MSVWEWLQPRIDFITGHRRPGWRWNEPYQSVIGQGSYNSGQSWNPPVTQLTAQTASSNVPYDPSVEWDMSRHPASEDSTAFDRPANPGIVSNNSGSTGFMTSPWTASQLKNWGKISKNMKKGSWKKNGGFGINRPSPAALQSVPVTRKFFDTNEITVVSGVAGSSSSFYALVTAVPAGIATGTDFNQRIGRRIQVTQIELMLRITAGATSSNILKFCIVWVRDSQGVLPTVGNYDLTVAANAVRNLNYSQDFRTIKKWLVRVDSSTAGSSPTNMFLQDVAKPFNNGPTTFTGTTGLQADMELGHYYLYMAQTTVIGANTAAFVYNIRQRYVNL